MLSLDGWTPLHLGAYYGNDGIVRILLQDNRSNVNVKSEVYGTPLHCACSQSNTHIVQILLMNGANNSITNS